MIAPKHVERLKEIATALAPKSRGDLRCYHVAAIFKKRKMVSLAQNTEKSHPKNQELNYHENCLGLHAECAAILRGGREDYGGHVLAVVRVDRNNKINSSKPCLHCQRLIRSVGLKRIFYTDENGEFQKFEN